MPLSGIMSRASCSHHSIFFNLPRFPFCLKKKNFFKALYQQESEYLSESVSDRHRLPRFSPSSLFTVSHKRVEDIKGRTSTEKSFQKTNRDGALSFEFRLINQMARLSHIQGGSTCTVCAWGALQSRTATEMFFPLNPGRWQSLWMYLQGLYCTQGEFAGWLEDCSF